MTATEIPTASPTPTATPKDFSDLPYAKTFREAYELEGSVTEEDVLSGRLIKYAAILDVEPSDESISPLKVKISKLYAEIYEIAFLSPDGVEIVAIFPYDDSHGIRKCIAIQRIPTDKGHKYLQYGFSPDPDSRIGKMLLDNIDGREVINPYYQSGQSQWMYDTMKEDLLDENVTVLLDVDELWVGDLPKVQALMEQWADTGEFPDELSSYVLEPVVTTPSE
jgi:hypothetical protein